MKQTMRESISLQTPRDGGRNTHSSKESFSRTRSRSFSRETGSRRTSGYQSRGDSSPRNRNRDISHRDTDDNRRDRNYGGDDRFSRRSDQNRRDWSRDRRDRSRSRERKNSYAKSDSNSSKYNGSSNVDIKNSENVGRSIVVTDPYLPQLQDDPRVGPNGVKAVRTKGKGQNTESFDPRSTIVRPDVRIIIGPNTETYGKPLKHDDVVVVPNFFCDVDDWSLYYKLIEEMREVQAKDSKGSEWISWAEGAHLITKNPTGSPAYQAIQDKIAKYFQIPQTSVGTRFNWYRDSSDWKPFHHDSAAFNPQRAANQNITVGASFGCSRELAFLHAKTGTKIYFPQTNGMLFSFGRDANITWKHGINALSEEDQASVGGKGRVSIILWGLAGNCVEEADSPSMLPYNGHSSGGYSGPSSKLSGSGVCRDFLKGNCNRGDNCKFSH